MRNPLKPLGLAECLKRVLAGRLDLWENFGTNRRAAGCKCCGVALKPGAGRGRCFFAADCYTGKTRYLCAECDGKLAKELAAL